MRYNELLLMPNNSFGLFRLARGAWRFDPIASVQMLQQQQQAAERLSVAGSLTTEVLQQVVTELQGLPSWGDREKDARESISSPLGPEASRSFLLLVPSDKRAN